MGETVPMTKAKFLVWAWTYGTLHVEEYDSLDEAVGIVKAASDAGSESFDHIEEVGVGTVDPDLVSRMWREKDRESDARYAEQPKATHAVELRSEVGKGEWAILRWVYDGAESAEVVAAEVRNTFGDERVRIRSFPLH